MTGADTFNPTGFEQAVMTLLYRYFERKGRSWSYISQDWMLEKLEAWHGVKRGRRALNDALRRLEEAGLISRVQRHCKDPVTGKFSPQVTMHKLTSGLKSWAKRQVRLLRGAAPMAVPGRSDGITQAGRKARLFEAKKGHKAATRAVPCECGNMIDRDRHGEWSCRNCGTGYDDAGASYLDQERQRRAADPQRGEAPAPTMTAADILSKFEQFKRLF